MGLKLHFYLVGPAAWAAIQSFALLQHMAFETLTSPYRAISLRSLVSCMETFGIFMDTECSYMFLVVVKDEQEK